MKRAILGAAALLLVAASPAQETRHTVKDGETLNGIANRAGVSASAIVKANGLKQPYVVRSGQVLKIPRDGAKPKPAAPASSGGSGGSSATASKGFHVVQDGETLNGIANRAGVTPAAIIKANNLKAPAYAVRLGQKLRIPGKGGSATAQAPAKPDSSKPDSASKAETPIRMGETNIVQPGETLNGIATRAGIPKTVLADANGIGAPYVVKTGQKLRIPRQRVHVVASGDTASEIAEKYGVSYDAIRTANGLPGGSSPKVGQRLVIPATVARSAPAIPAAPAASSASATPSTDGSFRWPLIGKIVRRFDLQAPGAGHRGIDIDASVGQAVMAARAGTVIYAADEPIRYGKMIVVEHEGQWYSAYAHLSSIAVAKGDSVKVGEVIGYAGSTGDAPQPQLHFELRQANRPVDPLTKLP